MTTASRAWRNSVVDQVGAKVHERILRKGLRPGDRLPTYRELVRELDVAYMTVKRGVDALVADGTVARIHGKGLFVGEGAFRRRPTLGRVLVLFATSMHYVLSYVYAGEVARGILTTLGANGIASRLRSMVEEGIIFGDYVDSLDVDAVILVGVENDEYLRMAANWGQPAVALDYCSTAVPMDFVACDNRAATRRCVEHLAGLGHRQLVYVGASEVAKRWMQGQRKEFLIQRASDARERREGVWEAAAACGLPEPRLVQAAGDSASLGTSLTRAFDAGAQPPTAVVLISELDAPGVMRWLAGRGLRVPQDISICAVAGAGENTVCPALTFCRFDFPGMGRKAVEVLHERFARPEAPVNRIHRIGFEWVEGSTCGARV